MSDKKNHVQIPESPVERLVWAYFISRARSATYRKPVAPLVGNTLINTLIVWIANPEDPELSGKVSALTRDPKIISHMASPEAIAWVMADLDLEDVEDVLTKYLKAEESESHYYRGLLLNLVHGLDERIMNSMDVNVLNSKTLAKVLDNHGSEIPGAAEFYGYRLINHSSKVLAVSVDRLVGRCLKLLSVPPATTEPVATEETDNKE